LHREYNNQNKDFILAKEQKLNLIKTTTSIDDFTDFTIKSDKSNQNPFEVDFSNKNINGEVSDSQENKHHRGELDIKDNNSNNNNNLNDGSNVNKSLTIEKHNEELLIKPNNNSSYSNKIKDEKNRDSLKSEINLNRDSIENINNKTHDSSVIKHHINKNPDQSKLKINIDPPFLPSKSIMRNPRPYTLVLDLDETLVHFVEENDSAYIQIRPGAEHFLEEMHKYYEIVVFTAAMQDVIKI